MNEQDLDIRDILVQLGEKRPTADILAYMRTNKTVRSIDLERVAALRQPEVSNGMKELSGRGWITSITEPKIGKGRPVKVYTLVVDFNTIIEKYDACREANDISTKLTLTKLKELVKNGG